MLAHTTNTFVLSAQGIGQVLAVLKDMRAAFDRLANRIDTVETNVAVLAASGQKNTQAVLCHHCDKNLNQGEEHKTLMYFCTSDLSCTDFSH